MTYGDLSNLCRLCLIPLNGSYIDCTLDENKDLIDIIKTVYNIDIDDIDEISTNICVVCCDILMYNIIHYNRAVEAQKSLTRVQRIMKKLRQFGKKKSDKKSQKKPLPDTPIIDVEMTEELPIDSPMEYVETDIATTLANCQFNQWTITGQEEQEFIEWNYHTFEVHNNDNIDKKLSFHQSSLKRKIDENNNIVEQSPSIFLLAKNFCGNIMKKHKPNIESALDEITHQMANLRFTS